MAQVLLQGQDSARSIVVRNTITVLLFVYESFMRIWILLLIVLMYTGTPVQEHVKWG